MATKETKAGRKDYRAMMDFEWRTGRSKTWQAKLIYAQLEDKPSHGDPVIGQMESPLLAKCVVDDHNGWLE